VVGGPLQQDHAQLAFQALQLLAQRGLTDVLAGHGPPEMQLLGQGEEIALLVIQIPRGLIKGSLVRKSIQPARINAPVIV